MQANDYEILTSDANSGISYRNAVNEIFKAIKTLNSGNTEPLNPEAFMWWMDTANETYYYLKQRNAGNSGWNVLFRYTVANGAVHAISGGAVVDLEALTTAFSEALNAKADKEALNAKADKATTLSGYGITDAYTKEEVSTLLLDTKVTVNDSNIDLASADFFQKTITSATSFSLSNIKEVSSFILELTNAGAYAITWWSGIKWEKGVAPTLTASGVDILGFYTVDSGTTWRGFVLAKDSK